ncbi:uncharacterized protein LOC126717356 isoform X3 [Quercus robur]|uniref:uncharacterized protein LOC126717356 isoform X3 n=1 Tax=Quercus robur TaxID=38942 RepID=UPI00216137AD|nr:uncharacterized protein LOC126717356 isoform X3 [Quercus robur]
MLYMTDSIAIVLKRERVRVGDMANHNLVIDAWIKEAEEALKLVEGLENTIKNRNPEHFSLISNANSKLLELGVKLDRLESLLHNPPSKPNFNLFLQCIYRTDEELKFRWKMLSDIQLRTREVALSLYAFPSPNRSGGLPAADADAKENSTAIKSCCQDQMKVSSSEEDSELLEPLVMMQPKAIHSLVLIDQ